MDSGPPEYRALNNDLILEMILNNLKTPDLLRCRMVNQKWNKGATSILKRRPVYLKAIVGVAREYDELYNLMKNSPDFPFCGFGFTVYRPLKLKRKSLNTVAGRRFFGKFGPHFYYLHLRSAYIRTPDLVLLLSSFLPNTRVIELGEGSIEYDEECKEEAQEGFKNMNLPALREIKFGARPHCFYYIYSMEESYYFTALLRAATQLEKIEVDLRTTAGYDGILRAISATSNWDKVSKLALEYHPRLNVSLYQHLATNAPPLLTQLTLDYPYFELRSQSQRVSAAFANCVKTVLLSSAETLRSLVIGKVTVPMQQVPTTFPKLKALEFRQNGNILNLVSPGVSDHYEKFPAVMEIRLNLEDVTKGLLLEKFFEEGTVWNSVVKLDLFCEVSPDGIMHLATVFPSVTHIVIHFPRFFGKDKENLSRLPYLREFRALEKLEFLYITKRHFEPHLDELLTGIPLSVCRKLRTGVKRKLCDGCCEIIRSLGGIVHLRETALKELVLYLYHASCPNNLEGDPLISEASVWYGLEMLPGVRTVLKVPNKAEDLAAAATLPEAVKQFVTIVNM